MIRNVSLRGFRAEARERMQHIPGKVIVRFKGDAIRASLGTAAGLKFSEDAAKGLSEGVTEPLKYLRQNAGLRDVRPLFSTRKEELERRSPDLTPASRQRLAVATSVTNSSNEDLSGFSILSVSAKEVSAKLLRHIAASKAVDFIEPMPARWLAATEPNDPSRNLQWGLRAVEWFGASIPDASAVKVGIMDTGIDPKHPDLKDVTLDYRPGSFSKTDVLGHGTHVAGIIAATTNNAVGICGVASCSITMWKIFGDEPAPDGEFYVDGETFLTALRDARAARMQVVNLSIGGTAHSQTEDILMRRLINEGVLVVAAMGNEYLKGNPVEYPAAYAGVLAVGAVQETKRRAAFSNTGKHIGIAAPGSNILSTLPLALNEYRDEAEYAAWSGTSMATPHVAGTAALVLANNPDWSGGEVKGKLTESATKLKSMGKKSWTAEYGSGLLNVTKALT